MKKVLDQENGITTLYHDLGDRVVVQNGTDSPLVLDPTNWAASTKHAAVTADDVTKTRLI